MSLQLVVPPAVEPVSLSELKEFLRIDPGDTSNDATIWSLGVAARQWTEVYCQRRWVTQTWRLSVDFFPGYIDMKLVGQKVSSPFVSGSNAILVGIRYALVLPFPPVQSIASFIYQNANGQVTSMIQGPNMIASVTNTYGAPLQLVTSTPHGLQTGSAVTLAGNSSLISFLNGETFENVTVLDANTFLLNGTVGDGTTSISGGGTATGYNYTHDLASQPARLTPIFGQMWPVARVIVNAVQVEFVCGYGGPVTVSMDPNSTAITGATFASTDVGKPISIPGAGPNGDTLNTILAAVDGSGNGTTRTAAFTGVTDVTAVMNIPEGIKTAIKLLTTYWYENRVPDNNNIPMAVKAVLGPYRDLRF
jgi:hypothetical protein